MISAKTGSLLRMLVSMLGVFLKIDKENITALVSVMNYIGISFQITDDILNVTHRKESGMGKGIIA